jgi:PAS domain S-box-containing protein
MSRRGDQEAAARGIEGIGPDGFVAALLRHASDAIAVSERESGRFVVVSDSYCVLTGYARDDLIGRTSVELGLVADHAVRSQALDGPGQDRGDVRQLQVHRKDGELRLFEFSVQLLAGELMLTISRDVTERRELEAQLQERDERFRLLAENSPDVIRLYDADGTIRYASPSSLAVLGYTPEELIGRHSSVFQHPDDDAIRAGRERAVMAADAEVRLTYRSRHKNGGYVWLESSVRALRDEQLGVVTGFQEAARDISDRKYADNEILQAGEEAEQANRAKSDFLSSMSHELRTPLNVILGFAQLLEMDATQPAERERVAQILTAGAHLLELINEVLDLSAVESGRMKISCEPVLVSEVLGETIKMIRPLADTNSVSLSGPPPDSPDRYVLADRQRLKQVLLNLLVNAVKYNVGGGTVAIRCEPVRETRVRIVITDTGIGIAERDLQRLFVPFERLGPDPAAVEGTGLGLALSKGIVEAMDGEITAISEVGKGSTFSVEFATAQPPPPDTERSRPSEAAEQPRVQQPTRTILYVEDNPANVKLVEHVLALRPEITLIVAMQGTLGIDLAREHDPSLILLDLNLPDVPGDEVLRRLKADPRTADTPVVVISADATAGQLDRLRANGAADYLSKPFDVTRFLAIVDQSAQRGKQPRRSLLAALRERGTPIEQLESIVAAFLRHSAESIDLLATAIADGDLDAVGDDCHDLRGASLSFGAANLGKIAGELEAAARSDNLPAVRELHEPLVRAFDDARAVLLADYPNAETAGPGDA